MREEERHAFDTEVDTLLLGIAKQQSIFDRQQGRDINSIPCYFTLDMRPGKDPEPQDPKEWDLDAEEAK